MKPERPTKNETSILSLGLLGLLTLQLALLWVQGGLLNRQAREIRGLRDDVQTLAESMEAGAMDGSPQSGPLLPSKHLGRRSPVFLRARYQEDTAPEQGAKDMKTTRDSGQKAVKDAREVQSKLSIEENYRKAEEKKKLQAVESQWPKWVGAGVVIAVVVLLARLWQRHKEG